MLAQEELKVNSPAGFRRTVRRYWMLCKVSFQERMEYRWNIMMYMLMLLLPALVGIYLWSTVLSNGKDPTAVRNICTYYVVATFVGWRIHMFQWNIMNDVREGRMANFLLRPMSYPANCFWYEVGGRTWSTILTLPIFVGMALALGSNFKPPDQPMTWPVVILAFMISFTLNFFMTASLGLLTIWQNQPEGFFWLFDVAARWLGGTMIPLAFMPWGLGDWLQWLPFAYVYGLPARIFMGLPAEQVLQGFAVQLAWLVGFGLLFRWFWRVAQRRYEAYEG